MTRRSIIVAIAGVLTGVLAGWMLLTLVPRWSGPRSNAVAAPAPTAPATPGRKIKARLYYVSQDGLRLSGLERDIAYGDTPAAQAQEIVNAQIAPVAEPLVSAVPAGTKLRALYMTDRGEAYVDLSGEVVSAHSGGSQDELLTVYTIVNALTTNLPAVTTVQVLVDGKEIETLAGHVDLRQPLAKNLSWVE
jgi:spore germination protein GerM